MCLYFTDIYRLTETFTVFLRRYFQEGNECSQFLIPSYLKTPCTPLLQLGTSQSLNNLKKENGVIGFLTTVVRYPHSPGEDSSTKKHKIFKTYTFVEAFSPALSDTFQSVIC